MAIAYIAAAVTLAAVFASSASAQSYSYLDLGTYGGIYNSSKATGINNSGQVVGSSYEYNGVAAIGMLWNGAAPPLAFNYSLSSFRPADISNTGQVVGSIKGGSPVHSATWNGGPLTDIGALTAEAINDAGQVVGYGRFNGALHATSSVGGTLTDLGTLGGDSSKAYGLNNLGQVVGNSSRSIAVGGSSHATLWSGGTMTDLGTLDNANSAAVSLAYAINNAGQVVGYGTSPGYFGYSHAIMWSGGAAMDLGTLPGGLASYAYSINSSGQVVGSTGGVTGGGGEGRVATFWGDGHVINLNDYLDPGLAAQGWELTEAIAINDKGAIAVNAVNNVTHLMHAGLLSPNTVLSPVPEPETYAMMLAGLGLLGFMARRGKQIAS